MSNNLHTAKHTVLNSDQPDWNVDQIIEQISADLGEASPGLSTVRQTVNALFANYNDARVKTFVPVLVRRHAIEMLRQSQPEPLSKFE